MYFVEDDVVDSALNPLIAFGLWNRSKVNAVLSNKVENIVFDSISKMKTICQHLCAHIGSVGFVYLLHLSCVPPS